jgi:hypothetical protein
MIDAKQLRRVAEASGVLVLDRGQLAKLRALGMLPVVPKIDPIPGYGVWRALEAARTAGRVPAAPQRPPLAYARPAASADRLEGHAPMMKLIRGSVLGLAFFALCGAANATTLLPSTPITAAISPAVTGSVYQFATTAAPRSVTAQATFTYGSGGTTVDAYLQTSLDGGTTWSDVANFHFTTASARKVVNLSSDTPVTTPVTPTDGTMTNNTALDGVIGTKLRVKYQSSGTYAGGTTLAIDVQGARITQ